ncbi:hypothetical protein AUR64_17100 [Haloprofundus marisrubri]|uniref:DUF7115 domain-containing protein n=1 Tax=Haloprofundus marisrubri TaxID=1514971 RepID=A0A0W1R8B1_9EURY|nr:hypothetical protein [Haloprofundus marisrubri]KTG09489.1 hypothetical protein AUR64_17100 [Haloprofundus marisrubri]
MSLPELVQTELDDEPVAARVSLGGEDGLFVTPTRTLIYRSEGLLSDESVEQYPHDAERISVSEGGRTSRKATVTLDYGLDGEQSFSIPSKRLQDALHPVLAGILSATGITDPGETVKQTFRFSELTLVVTSNRVVKHIGAPVWDEDFEEYHYADVTDLTFEDGSVATSVVLTLGSRQERFKAPNDEARAVRETLTDALCTYHEVPSLDAFRKAKARESEAEPTQDRKNVSFGDGPAPLKANPTELSEKPKNATRPDDPVDLGDDSADTPKEVTGSAGTAAESQSAASATSTTQMGAAESSTFEGSGFESASDDSAAAETSAPASASPETAVPEPATESASTATAANDDIAELRAQLTTLTETVEQQNEELQRQAELIERLIDELSRGR